MQSGHTYLQVLMVVGIITILAAVASPFYVQFQYRQRLYSVSDGLLSDLRLTQAKAMQSEQNDVWGIHVSDTDKAYVIFYGSSYNPTESNNMSVAYPDSISISPDQDVVFSEVEGLPDIGSTSFTVSSTNLSDTQTITINEEGQTDSN